MKVVIYLVNDGMADEVYVEVTEGGTVRSSNPLETEDLTDDVVRIYRQGLRGRAFLDKVIESYNDGMVLTSQIEDD